MKLQITSVIALGILFAVSNLHAEFLPCQMQLKHTKNSYQMGEKYIGDKKSMPMLKYTAKQFKKHLGKARMECVGLDAPHQADADKRLAYFNDLEKKFIEMGVLKSSAKE